MVGKDIRIRTSVANAKSIPGAEARVNTLRTIVQKTLQTYRIRSNLMHKRHQFLKQAGRDPNQFTEENFTTLRNILDREKRVLAIIEKGNTEVKGGAEFALHTLESFSNVVDVNKDITDYGSKIGQFGHTISLKDLNQFLDSVTNLLNRGVSEIHRIRQRIDKEEHFLESRDANAFNEFILAWDDEVREDEKLFKYYKDIVERNRKFFNI